MPPEQTELEKVQATALCIHDAENVRQALDRMAVDITATLGGSVPVILCVLNGGIIPTGHLLTRLQFPLETDYLHATRYRGGTRGVEEVLWICEPALSLQDRTVLVIDDILDEGHTLAAIIGYCKKAGARQVYSAVLVQKLHNRCAGHVRADFVGLQVDDRYVFGFGMDYKGFFRNMNGIFALHQADGERDSPPGSDDG